VKITGGGAFVPSLYRRDGTPGKLGTQSAPFAHVSRRNAMPVTCTLCISVHISDWDCILSSENLAGLRGCIVARRQDYRIRVGWIEIIFAE